MPPIPLSQSHCRDRGPISVNQRPPFSFRLCWVLEFSPPTTLHHVHSDQAKSENNSFCMREFKKNYNDYIRLGIIKSRLAV